MYLIGNYEEITAAASSSLDIQLSDADEALREVVYVLLDWKMNDGSNMNCSGDELVISNNARRVAQFACDKIEVPRDMGMIPALSLGKLVQSLL